MDGTLSKSKFFAEAPGISINGYWKGNEVQVSVGTHLSSIEMYFDDLPKQKLFMIDYPTDEHGVTITSNHLSLKFKSDKLYPKRFNEAEFINLLERIVHSSNKIRQIKST